LRTFSSLDVSDAVFRGAADMDIPINCRTLGFTVIQPHVQLFTVGLIPDGLYIVRVSMRTGLHLFSYF
jgi:hypothetical protein